MKFFIYYLGQSVRDPASRKGTKIIASDLDSFLKECKLASETIDYKLSSIWMKHFG